jgi:hypothetical protein
MALRFPRGIDPSETWDLDYVQAEGRHRLAVLKASIARQKEDAPKVESAEKRAALEAALARAEKAAATLEADLATYERGSGPIFVIGHIPNAKRAELSGDYDEVAALADGKEYRVRDRAWAESVVRWSVKGHRNLISDTGKPILFETEEAEFGGAKVQVVARQTLEAYGAFNLLTALPLLILSAQQIDEAGKNA